MALKVVLRYKELGALQVEKCNQLQTWAKSMKRH